MNNVTRRPRGPQRKKESKEIPAHLVNYWNVLKKDWFTSSDRSFLYSYLKEKSPALSETQLFSRANAFIYDIETGRKSTDRLTINMLMKHCKKDRVLANDLLYSEDSGIDKDAVNQLLEVATDFVCPLLIDLYYPVSMYLCKKKNRILYIVTCIDFSELYDIINYQKEYVFAETHVEVTDNADKAQSIFCGCIDDCKEELSDPEGINVIDPTVSIPSKLEKYFTRKIDQRGTLSDQTKQASLVSGKTYSRSLV